jgi:hypothetical protein
MTNVFPIIRGPSSPGPTPPIVIPSLPQGPSSQPDIYPAIGPTGQPILPWNTPFLGAQNPLPSLPHINTPAEDFWAAHPFNPFAGLGDSQTWTPDHPEDTTPMTGEELAYALDRMRTQQANDPANRGGASMQSLIASYQADVMRLAQLAQEYEQAQVNAAGAGYSAEMSAISAQIAELEAHKQETDTELRQLMVDIAPVFEKASASAADAKDSSQGAAAASIGSVQAQTTTQHLASVSVSTQTASKMGLSGDLGARFAEGLDQLQGFVDEGFALTAEGMQATLEAGSILAQSTANAEFATAKGEISMERQQRVRSYEEAIKQLVIRRNALGGAKAAAEAAAQAEARYMFGQDLPVTETDMVNTLLTKYMGNAGINERDQAIIGDSWMEAYTHGQTPSQYLATMETARSAAQADPDAWAEWQMSGDEGQWSILQRNLDVFEMGDGLYQEASDFYYRAIGGDLDTPFGSYFSARYQALQGGYTPSQASYYANQPGIVSGLQTTGVPMSDLSSILQGLNGGSSPDPFGLNGIIGGGSSRP